MRQRENTWHAACDSGGMNTALAALSIASFFIGQYLVTRRHWTGFLVWALSNLSVALGSFSAGHGATGTMFAIYFAANAWSLFSWTKPVPA